MSSGHLPFDDDSPLPLDEPSTPAATPPSVPASGSASSLSPEPVRELPVDEAARAAARDPRQNVALQASAGTGKTRVLVDRFVNLLIAGVEPANILAITFTRKAAAEMRERIVATLRIAAVRGEIPAARWLSLRDRLGDIAISTIDAFCLSLLREFPLEADLDPGFRMADDTEVPRLMDEAIDRTLRIGRGLAKDDEGVAIVFRQLGDRRVRTGLSALLGRRLVAPSLLERFLEGGTTTAEEASARLVRDLRDAFEGASGGLDGFLDSAPELLSCALLKVGLEAHIGEAPVRAGEEAQAGHAAEAREAVPLPALVAALTDYMLTQDGEPRRGGFLFRKDDFATPDRFKRHKELMIALAPAVHEALRRYRAAVNQVASSGVRRLFAIARTEYQRTLDAHAVLDFPDVLARACALLRQMDEFAQSRFRLEGRYHHILVDEFQDTSHAQWELVTLLIRAWREGSGVSDTGPLHPSIFIVGDPKQSIYGFRDADPGILHDAARFLETLRPGGRPRQSISQSFRSVPAVLAFVNDVCEAVASGAGESRDAFRYAETDRFPLPKFLQSAEPELGLVAAETPEACAERVAHEIAHLLATATVRDRETGVHRPARAGDVAILFRSRDSHRAFEQALEAVGVRTHVYKGLGFFDADEVKDALALLWCLAAPQSDLRVAAWLRSRLVGLSDAALTALAPRVATALAGPGARTPEALTPLDRDLLTHARAAFLRWRGLVDVLPPAELLDRVLDESAYYAELRGPRRAQATENLKKLRSLIRRLQNRGYATLARVVEHIDRLSLGDESNAVIDATDAVNLMTVHASKGLEFPVVFVVNLAKGTGNWRDPIRVSAGRDADDAVSVSIGAFQSDADEQRPGREKEETKRLVYVALTRARDRLYLGTVVKEGLAKPGLGSLGEVLPAGLLALFGAASGTGAGTGAGTGGTPLEWQGPSGTAHRFRVAGLVSPPALPPSASDAAIAPAEVTAYARLDAPVEARAITEIAGEAEGHVESGAASDRLVGTLVHRLMERYGRAGQEASVVAEALPALLGPDALPDEAADRERLAARAVAAHRDLAGQPEVARLLASGEVHHEVPFSVRVEGAVRRGVLDCLVRDGEGRITVLEFKTGRRRPEHMLQLEAYRQAAAQVFPDAVVEAKLFYPNNLGAETK